jgi:hypothetical protein
MEYTFGPLVFNFERPARFATQGTADPLMCVRQRAPDRLREIDVDENR